MTTRHESDGIRVRKSQRLFERAMVHDMMMHLDISEHGLDEAQE